MADQTQTIRIVIDARGARTGSEDARRALRGIKDDTEQSAKSLTRMETMLGTVGSRLKTFATVVAAGFLTKFATDALDAVASLDELAEQLGVTTQGLQGLQFSAVQNGVKLEQLEGGISKFSQKMGEAAEGSKEMVEALTRLGVKNLDVQGKLLPTEVLLQRVADAITKIDDPARRAAAAVDFFGKAGTRMLPMLGDIAAGVDVMAQKAAAAGALIDDTVIKALDRASDQASVASLRFRALFADIGAPIITASLEAVNGILAAILGNLNRLKEMEATKGSRAHDVDAANLEERIAVQRNLLAINPNNKMAQSSIAALEKQRDASRDQAKILRDQRAVEMMVSGTFAPTPPMPAAGAATSTAKTGGGGGETPEQKYAKLMRQLNETAAAQEKMTEAARRGDLAYQDQQAHLDAVQKTMEIFGRRLDDNDPKLKEVEERLRRISEGKAAETFARQTTELENQNAVLEAEIKLRDVSNEQRAVEIALLKSTQDAQKAGQSLTADDIERRRTAIEQNEKLKGQGEELKKANELWTAPLKSALESIQQTAADAWETILETGKVSFQSLGEVFLKTIRRMAAEFLALATIRPVMSVLVQALGPGGAGIISAGTAQQLGVSGGGGASAGGIPGLGGGGGGFGGLGSLFGGGGGGGLLSGLSGWLQTPFTGNFAGISPSAMEGVLGAGSSGAANLSYFSNLPGQGLGFTPGGLISGGMSIGMGAMSLLGNKSGNTAQTIGGIGQMVGGALMMIPTPWTMAAGAIISIASSILPSLFGDSGPKRPPQPALSLSTGSFAADASGRYTDFGGGSMGAGSSLNDQAKGLAGRVTDMFRLARLRPVPGSVIGGSVMSGVNNVAFGNQQWQQVPYTASNLVLPGGNVEWLVRSSQMNAEQQAEWTAARVFEANVNRGGVSGVSDSLRTALKAGQPKTIEETESLIEFVNAYDDLTKTITGAESALREIDDRFDSMKDRAVELGLALKPLEDAQAKARTEYAEEFKHTIDMALDPVGTALADFAKQREAEAAELKYINDNIKGVIIETARFEEYQAKKEAALKEQLYGGAVSSLQQLVNSLLPGGAGANVDPSGTLSGLKATFTGTLAQARAGDASAIARLAGEGGAYAQFAQSYFAGSAEYNAIRDAILQAALEVQGAIQAPANGGTTPLNTAAGAATNQAVAQLMAVNAEQSRQITQLLSEITRLTATLSRYVKAA